MAIQSSFYTPDGTTRTFPSTKHIATKQHMAIWYRRISDNLWEIQSVSKYELINNAAVLVEAPDALVYDSIEIRVADTFDELTTSPSSIVTVASISADVTGVNAISDEVVIVSGLAAEVADIGVDPLRTAVLNAATNATSAATSESNAATSESNAAAIATSSQLSAWEAEAERLTAGSYATQLANVYVNSYTSNGDGTYTATPTTAYSALHWAANGVHLTGDQTIDGTKTFSSSPIIPDATQLQHAINKNQLDTKYTGFKNYIINGNFDIWQRGISQTTAGYDSDDRWVNTHIGSTKTHSAVACTDTERALFNAVYYSRTAVTSVAGSSNYVINSQKIEDVTRMAGKTVTISFLAKADTNKNIAIDFVQDFGTGGTPSVTIAGIGSQLVPLSTTWQKKTITVTIPSIVGKTLGTDGANTSYTSINFWFDAGSTFDTRTAALGQQSGTFDIAQVQIEEGAVATPFENRPFGLELALCQRYYETIGVVFTGYSVSGNPFGGLVPYSKKRIESPSITLSVDNYYTTNVNSGTEIIYSRSSSGAFVARSTTYTGYIKWSGKYAIDSEL